MTLRAAPRTLPRDPDLRRLFRRLHERFPKDAQIAHASGHGANTIRMWRLEKQRISLPAFRDLAATAGLQVTLTEKE
jgi:hypothetical protein